MEHEADNVGVVIEMPRKKPVQPDTEAAAKIAAAFTSMKLDPKDPQDWITAVREAGEEYPSEETIRAAHAEVARMMRPPIQIATRRDAHHLRRRR